MEALPIDSPASLPPGVPFTARQAHAAGLSRTDVERQLRTGLLRRLIRGVYLDTGARETSLIRGEAVHLIAGPRSVAVGRTAAWIMLGSAIGVAPERLDLRPRSVALQTIVVGRQWLTTPLRTAVDIGRELPEPAALGIIDALLRADLLERMELLAAVSGLGGVPHVRRLRQLAALADERSGGLAESALRLWWCCAELPTPQLGIEVAGARVCLALPVSRFGAVLSRRVDAEQALAWEHQGWRVVVLPELRVLGADGELVGGHLVAEFRKHLLSEVG